MPFSSICDSSAVFGEADRRVQGYTFTMLKPASLSYKDMPWCPGVPEPEEHTLVPVDVHFNHLIILGAQKAGTTWLFDALDTHPRFHGATHGFRCAYSTCFSTSVYSRP